MYVYFFVQVVHFLQRQLLATHIQLWHTAENVKMAPSGLRQMTVWGAGVVVYLEEVRVEHQPGDPDLHRPDHFGPDHSPDDPFGMD